MIRETVLSPWLSADEGKVSHVLSHVVWWNIYIYNQEKPRKIRWYQERVEKDHTVGWWEFEAQITLSISWRIGIRFTLIVLWHQKSIITSQNFLKNVFKMTRKVGSRLSSICLDPQMNLDRIWTDLQSSWGWIHRTKIECLNLRRRKS